MMNMKRNKCTPNIISNSVKKAVEDVLRSLFSAKIHIIEKDNPFKQISFHSASTFFFLL